MGVRAGMRGGDHDEQCRSCGDELTDDNADDEHDDLCIYCADDLDALGIDVDDIDVSFD